MITICDQTARHTSVLPIGQPLPDGRAAGAGLARAAWVYLHQLTTGAFSLVREFVDEGRPSGIMNGLRQPTARKSFDVEVFYGDQAVAIDDLARELVVEVRATIEHATIAKGEHRRGLASPVASALPPSESPVTGSDVCLCCPTKPRISGGSAVTECGEVRQTHVDADRLGGRWQRGYFNFSADAGVPLPALSLHRDGLRGADEGAMQFDLQVSNLRDGQPIAEPEAALAESHRVEAVERSEAREPRLLASLAPPIERPKGSIQSAQDSLKHLRVDRCHIVALGLDWRELGGLAEEANRDTVAAPCVSPFLKRGVIKLATYSQVGFERVALGVRWVEPVAIGSQRHFSAYFTS